MAAVNEAYEVLSDPGQRSPIRISWRTHAHIRAARTLRQRRRPERSSISPRRRRFPWWIPRRWDAARASIRALLPGRWRWRWSRGWPSVPLSVQRRRPLSAEPALSMYFTRRCYISLEYMCGNQSRQQVRHGIRVSNIVRHRGVVYSARSLIIYTTSQGNIR
jgi:hypothetical protein